MESLYGSGFMFFLLLIVAFLIFVSLSIIIQHVRNPHLMENKFSWLRDLANVGAMLVGIVLTAIGGVMFINSLLKVYVFNFETSPHFNAQEMCEERWVPAKDGGSKQERLTPEEIEKCMTDKTEYEKTRYARRQKETLIDGFGFLLVGAFFWLLHRRKKGKK